MRAPQSCGTIDVDVALAGAAYSQSATFIVADVWRDYARQSSAIAIDKGVFERLTGELLEFGSASQIRATSLRVFDRSFAVTYWLQAVAIAIGLFGVTASFSAQVLSRRKEFGLLAHLGLTRKQILQVVALRSE